MHTQVGTFAVEDAFHITERGWVLAGKVNGTICSGNQLAFDNGILLIVSGVNLINTLCTDKIGLLTSAQFASRQDLIDQNILGATAQILE